MSNPYPPPTPPNPNRQGRDPRLPFGTPTPNSFNQPTSIQDYQEPRRKGARPLLLGLLVLALVGALLFGLHFFGASETAQEPKSSGLAPSQVPSSFGAGQSSAPFEGNGSGQFEVVSHSWGVNGVDVTVRISLNEGDTSFSFYLISNTSMLNYRPDNESDVWVSGGETKETTMHFDAPQEECTIVLASAGGKPLSAIKIAP